MTQLTLFLLQTCRNLDSFSTTESCACIHAKKVFVSFTALLGTADKSVASHLVTDAFHTHTHPSPAAMVENVLHFCFLPESELLSNLFHAGKSSVSCAELSAGSKGKKRQPEASQRWMQGMHHCETENRFSKQTAGTEWMDGEMSDRLTTCSCFLKTLGYLKTSRRSSAGVAE